MTPDELAQLRSLFPAAHWEVARRDVFVPAQPPLSPAQAIIERVGARARPLTPPPRQTTRCSLCGQRGHNLRTCRT